MAWENLREELEQEFDELGTANDSNTMVALSDFLARIRSYKAQWQRQKWLKHKEPVIVASKRVRHAHNHNWRGKRCSSH